MLSLILGIAVSLCQTTCCVFAAMELDRIGNSSAGPSRYPRLWRVWHIVFYTSLAGELAFAILCFFDLI